MNDQVAGVGGTRPLENVLSKALKGRFPFEAQKYIFPFQSYVHFEEFIVSRAFVRFGAKQSSSGLLVSTKSWSSFLKLRSVTRLFLRIPTTTFGKIPFFFLKQSHCYLPDGHGDPQDEQGTSVRVRQKLQ